MTDPFLSLPTIRAGFPSPAQEYREDDLDYNAYFKRNPASTMARRVDGDSMIDANIPHNAIVVIDRSLKPPNNSVVAVTLNGETLIKHLVTTQDGAFLLPANRRYKSLRVTNDMDFEVWGTVTHVIIDLFYNRHL